MFNTNHQFFLTVATKYLIKRLISIEQIQKALDLLEQMPFFKGLTCFDYVSWFPLRGRRNLVPVSEANINFLRNLIASQSIHSFGMGVHQKEHRFRYNEIAFSFPVTDLGDYEIGELQIYIEEARFSNTNWPIIREYFKSFLELLMPNYAFSAAHIDAFDTDELEKEFQRRLPFQPVDSLNDNRYVWDSNKLIRDVGWLNFFSQEHLSALNPTIVAMLRTQPWAIDVSGGLAFGIGDSPLDDYHNVLQYLRSVLAPIISPR